MVMRFLGKLQSFLYDSQSDLYIHQMLDAFRFSQISLELSIIINMRIGRFFLSILSASGGCAWSNELKLLYIHFLEMEIHRDF